MMKSKNNSNKSEVYVKDRHNAVIKELELVGWIKKTSSDSEILKPHIHKGVYEIHYLKKGLLRWWVGKERYVFKPGNIFVIKPDEVHGGDDDTLQPCEHYWIHFRMPGRGKTLQGMTVSETSVLRERFEKMTCRTFPVSDVMADYYEGMLAEHRKQKKAVRSRIYAFLDLLLTTILSDHENYNLSDGKVPQLITWRIRKTLHAIESASENVPVSTLAKEVGLSISGLRQRFKQETGFTLHDYQMNRRIDIARDRLQKTDEPVTRISMDLGFSSSQYFATTFQKEVGISPTEYRRRHYKK